MNLQDIKLLKKISIYLALGCLWVLSINICDAQKGLLLEFYEGNFQTPIVSKTRLKDSAQAILYLRNLTASKNKSYNWAYSIDSISVQNAVWRILVFPGFKFTSVIYKNTNLSPILYNELLRNYKNQAPEEFARLSSKYLSTKGYPFASVSFDSIQQKDNTLILKVLFKNATLVYFSKILNDNEILGISPKFLQDIIGIRLYDYFDLSKINAIPERIKSLGYFELTEQPNFIIEDSFCALKIPLREVKKNRFNGILGILPNSETSGELQFTGDVQLSLQNLFS